MNTFGATKNNGSDSRKRILGLFEDDYENESSILSAFTSTVVAVKDMAKDAVGGTYEAVSDLSKTVVIAEAKTESNGEGKFPTTGSLEGFDKAKSQAQIEQLKKQAEKTEKDRKETARKQAFYQALREEQERAARAKEKLLFEEEINDIATNLPTEQKNQLLHYQASYKDRSIYQQAELRKKLIEQHKKQETQEKQTSIPSPAKQPSALEGAFEGRSGSQGGGTANLSNQAVG